MATRGFKVDTVDSGKKAIAKVEQNHFDLIITDLMMEGMDGIQVLKHVKDLDPGLPVIILTGYGDMASAIDALRSGADDYMLKPCDIDELLFRISRCLEKFELLKQLKDQNRKLLDEISAREGAEEALKQSSEKIKRFAYSVSHDLKSPVIAITGLTNRLNEHYGDALGEKGQRYCDQIVKTSTQVLALVESINAYMSAKETIVRIEKVKLKDIFEMIREEFADRLEKRRIKWFEPETAPEIHADGLSILRVLRNVVDNALKYGGDQLNEIEIGYEEAPHFHTLFIRDNGIGMDTKDSHKIFGLFARKETSRRTEGSGLGLAIVKEIAKQHGGDVEVVSSHKTGTCFYISISKNLALSNQAGFA